MKKMQFCSNCLEDSNCSYNEKMINKVIDGVNIEYLEKYYICDSCGCKIYGDLLDYNTSEINKKLREKTDLISISEIEQICDKYSIGKKPLSLILGLGEITITRYIDGQNPTKENSELLKNILNNPLLYEMYLFANRDKITKIAYKKSLGKTKQEELKSNNSKLYEISLYIILKEKEVDPLTLQKQLFFVSGFSNKFLNDNIIVDNAEAWKYGPVYREIYDAFSYYGYNKIDIDELTKNREIHLSEKEKEYINAIIEAFGFYSGSILREMTHLTEPWKKSREGLEEFDNSSRVIDNKDIKLYFDDVCKKFNIESYNDIKKYSENLFEQAQNNIITNQI